MSETNHFEAAKQVREKGRGITSDMYRLCEGTCDVCNMTVGEVLKAIKEYCDEAAHGGDVPFELSALLNDIRTWVEAYASMKAQGWLE